MYNKYRFYESYVLPFISFKVISQNYLLRLKICESRSSDDKVSTAQARQHLYRQGHGEGLGEAQGRLEDRLEPGGQAGAKTGWSQDDRLGPAGSGLSSQVDRTVRWCRGLEPEG